VIDTPSKLNVIRKAAPLVRMLTTRDYDGEYWFLVYYESIKGELKIRPIYECRCDERLQTKAKEFTRLTYTEKYWE